MEDHKFLVYKDMKNLQKGDVIMVRNEFKNYEWCMGTFLGHMTAYGSAAMKFAFDYAKNENPDYQWTTVFTGLTLYESIWNDENKKRRQYRWPTEEELNEALLEQMDESLTR